MSDHIANREIIIRALREELVGPSPQGKQIDCSGEVEFAEARESYSPWRQQDSGEEILQRDPPTKRYGVAVLFPVATDYDSVSIEEYSEEVSDGSNGSDNSYSQIAGSANRLNDEQGPEAWGEIEAESDDFDLSTSNSYKPSSMAISFLADLSEESEVLVEASGGRYQKKIVKVGGKERIWWLRQPVSIESRFGFKDILAPGVTKVTASSVKINNCDGLNVGIELYSRPRGTGSSSLLTVCLVNREKASGFGDEKCLFQSHFKVKVHSPDGVANILPYPSESVSRPDLEEQSLALLYRRNETFGVGHGCAADWQVEPDANRATQVSAEALPEVETPSITPNVLRKDGTPVEVRMAALAGHIPGDDGFAALSEVVDLYEEWVEERESEIPDLPEQHRTSASRHLEECRRCIRRMRLGLDYLKKNERARRAFMLANHAVLLQQICTQREVRKASYDGRQQRIAFSEDYRDPSSVIVPSGRGFWRAFQVAFLLMAVHSSADGNAPERSTVELIWFPTGGGKTEAYLGLAAFSIFMRRLADPEDTGVQVLMRYTLRLLTAQQFQRASGLICAMEYLRRKSPEMLGHRAFSIGIWLGGTTSPNSRQDAIRNLRALNKNPKYTENRLVLTNCPWCKAQIGPIEYSGRKPQNSPGVLGYESQGSTVVFKCSDRKNCEFRTGLPVYVIDEDIYDNRPDLVIGTVDKFAMLSWRPQARTLFGVNKTGGQEFSPPGLIIQDELHLISGPLGSMVGLYEALIEELCTDRRNAHSVPPKIVSSTATIRRYADQIKALYARDDVALFPPPGLDAGDSFFAQFARKEDGSLDHGRRYIGIHAPGLGSMQTVQVRSFCSLLQTPVSMSAEDRDPWWTLMVFFNSLRELGTTLSLFQSDIQDYLKVLSNRTGKQFSALRQLRDIQELTGRLRSSEVPRAISNLETSCTSTSGNSAVDVCLASNIIEVGIDIDRLSIMAVVGQPKTTSQYIQVTGRVGRTWWKRPGLVITLYGTSKPRDRSHFEQFRTYHSQLYAQVEPTSVTPFSPPVLDRALHAIMSGYVRQRGNEGQSHSPYPYPEDLVDSIKDVVRRRIMAVDKEELSNFEEVFDKRQDEWRRWQHTQWGTFGQVNPNALLRQAGIYVASDLKFLSWPTPTSVRNVDAECEAEITRLYLGDEE